MSKKNTDPKKKEYQKRTVSLDLSQEDLNRLSRISGLVAESTAMLLALLKIADRYELGKLPYSEVLRLFQEDKIASYRLDMGSHELHFFRKGSDQPEGALIPGSKVFFQDIHELVKKRNEQNPEEAVRMEYHRGVPSSIYVGAGVLLLVLYMFRGLLVAQSRNVPQIRIMQGGGPADQKNEITKSSFTLETERKATFEDVAGAEEEKEELQEIIEYLKDTEKFTRLGARVPKGVLLVGPPGTGKTLLARAAAGEAEVPFFSISGSEFVEMFVGVGAARVRDLFENAKEKAPCIVFIDEIDAIAKKRSSTSIGSNEEREATLNQLLVEMDGFASDAGIIMMGATNRPDVLDPALLRPGRFDRRIYVGYPDINGRKAILKVHSKGKPLAPEVDLGEVAKNTSGFSGADLENLLNEAALLAAKRNQTAITNQDLQESAVKVMMGPEKRSKKVSEKERHLTAFHEAGHAIVTYHLPNLDPVTEVSITPRGSAGGYTMFQPQEDRNYQSKAEMLDELASLLGGRVAEALFIGDISTGASNDLERATQLARNMITRYGMNDTLGPVSFQNQGEDYYMPTKDYSEKTAELIDSETRKILSAAYQKAETLLKENKDKMEQLASFLLDHEKIDGSGFEKLMASKEKE